MQSDSEDDILMYSVSDDALEEAANPIFSLGNCTDARVCPIAEMHREQPPQEEA